MQVNGKFEGHHKGTFTPPGSTEEINYDFALIYDQDETPRVGVALAPVKVLAPTDEAEKAAFDRLCMSLKGDSGGKDSPKMDGEQVSWIVLTDGNYKLRFQRAATSTPTAKAS